MNNDNYKILKAMWENKQALIDARNFQKGKYFIGWEASARLSEVRHDPIIGKYVMTTIAPDSKKIKASCIDWEMMEKDNKELFEAIINIIQKI